MKRWTEYLNSILKKRNFYALFFIFLFIWSLNGVNDLLSYFLFAKEESRILTGIGLSLILTIPGLFLNKSLKPYLLLIYLLELCPSIAFFIHLILYKCPILNENYFIFYETSTQEIMEFTYQNINLKLLAFTIPYAAFPFLFFSRIKPVLAGTRKKIILIALCTMYLLLLFAFPLAGRLALLKYNNYYVDAACSYWYYADETNNLRKGAELRKRNSEYKIDLSNQPGFTKTGSPTSSLDSTKTNTLTYLIIIGESTGKYHMSIYGYERKTNPLLTSLKNNLYIFNHVISPNAHTIPCLEKMLTLSNSQHKLAPDSGESLISVFNKAGYNTYWISNQNKLGINETAISILSGEARNAYFEKNQLKGIGNPHDDCLLPVIKDVLIKDHRPKIIFIHLIGTHQDYKFRYPKEYAIFNGIPPEHFTGINEAKSNMINEYDNAITYNDYVVSSIFGLARQYAEYSLALYLSDHGDEVYEERDFLGHAEGNKSKYMMEIPFILWISDPFKKANKEYVANLNNDLNRSYCSADLAHSLIDIAKPNIPKSDSAQFDETRSIFSLKYKERDEYKYW